MKFHSASYKLTILNSSICYLLLTLSCNTAPCGQNQQ